jgi:hypothetical protein
MGIELPNWCPLAGGYPNHGIQEDP